MITTKNEVIAIRIVEKEASSEKKDGNGGMLELVIKRTTSKTTCQNKLLSKWE